MSKADRDRQALLQRLAREQRRALNAAARDADRARTPRTAPTPRRDDSPPSRTSEQPSAQSAARLKSLTPLYKHRQQQNLGQGIFSLCGFRHGYSPLSYRRSVMSGWEKPSSSVSSAKCQASSPPGKANFSSDG